MICPICRYDMVLKEVEIKGKKYEYYECYNCGYVFWLDIGTSILTSTLTSVYHDTNMNNNGKGGDKSG